MIRQNQDIRNMHCQKMATRFSIPSLFNLLDLDYDSHNHEKRRKWVLRMQSVRENTEKR